MKALNECIQLDHRLTHKIYGKRALPKELVQNTWTGVVKQKDDPKGLWEINTEVLVGKGLESYDEEEL